MMSDIRREISVPADNDGYILLQCSLCGEYFKITPSDYEDDGVLEIHCPSCGLCGASYFTEDVIELAQTMTQNVAKNLIYEKLKKWERTLKSERVSFKAGQKSKPEPENPVRVGVENLITAHFVCCGRSAKIKPTLKFTGCYCPFCGVKDYEIE